MKQILCVLLASALLAGCTESNEFGECIGIMEEGEPHLKYKVSVRNAIWSAIGIEFIIPGVLWVTDYAKCPVGPK